MNQERIYKVLLGPLVSEKATMAAELNNQIVFKVSSDATKPEIKAAVEQLFNVNVAGVQTVNIKGKTKRGKNGMGKRNDIHKAYVTLQEGQDIDFVAGE
ncbi:MAG: 50S ribosomal protein L23 [Pseudomonadales bacterium]